MVVKVVAKPLYSNFAIQDHTGGQIKVTKWVDHQVIVYWRSYCRHLRIIIFVK